MEKSAQTGVVIVAAGRGERAGNSHEGPKQYRLIGDKPVLARTLERFLSQPDCGPVVVVIHRDDEDLYARCLTYLPQSEKVLKVHGAETRQQSVLAGLEMLASHSPKYVMIQDAVRPFVSVGLLERIRDALEGGARAVLPAVAVTDTLKRANASMIVEDTVSRELLFAAQTPQSFLFEDILDAHRKVAAEGILSLTDDAAIAEWAGIPVHIVKGDPENVKLTLKRDIELADERLRWTMLPDVRTGNGYDVHQLVEGDGVTLCGVFLPHDRKLKGHSDADVALHALTDALLATCGAGDIGDHFPPSDPQWKGAPSKIFLEHAARIVRDAGGTIMNADISIIAEAPKIGPRRTEMREALASMLGIALERCSVKATTNEKIGFIGRGEGISAIATATVVFGGKHVQ